MEKERKYEFECSAALEGAEYTVQLTGYIRKNNHNAAKAVAELLDKKPAQAVLKVRLQDFYGGDIEEGLAIYDDLKARGVQIEGDGLVASMGTVILCAGSPVRVTKRLKAMMHRASGKVEGTADELAEVAVELRGLEQQLVDILAERTGLTAEVTRSTFLVEGVDTWFTAEQLRSLKLVDEVVPTDVRTVPMRELPKLKTAEVALERFAACYDHEQKPGPGKPKAMNKEITAALGLADGADESAVKTKVDAVMKENADLKAAAHARDEADKAKDLEAATTSIEAALKADRITKAQADILKEDAKTAPGVVAKTIATLTAGMPAHRSLIGALAGGGSKAVKSLEATLEKRTEEGWDFTRWSKEDPKGLERLRADHGELYAELRKTLG